MPINLSVKKEETVYDEVEVKMSKGENEAKEQTPDTNGELKKENTNPP